MSTYFAATSSGLQFEQVLINANQKELICEEVGKHWKKLGSALGLSSAFWITLRLITAVIAVKGYKKCLKSGNKKTEV